MNCHNCGEKLDLYRGAYLRDYRLKSDWWMAAYRAKMICERCFYRKVEHKICLEITGGSTLPIPWTFYAGMMFPILFCWQQKYLDYLKSKKKQKALKGEWNPGELGW